MKSYDDASALAIRVIQRTYGAGLAEVEFPGMEMFALNPEIMPELIASDAIIAAMQAITVGKNTGRGEEETAGFGQLVAMFRYEVVDFDLISVALWRYRSIKTTLGR